jgi:hypothetical protein
MQGNPMKNVLLLIGAITSSWACAQSTPTVDVRQIGDSSFELTLTTDETADIQQGQRLLEPVAEKLCKGKGATFGHYEFETKEALAKPPALRPSTTLVLHQDVRCGLELPSASRVPSIMVRHDDVAVEQLTYKYFSLRDTGNYKAAYSLFTDSMKASLTLDSWSASIQTFNAGAGKMKNRQIRKITWYDNPRGAPVPGTYAAVDHNGQFESLSFHCGYVMWFALPDGSFRLVREEENYVDKATAAKIGPEQLKTARTKFGC